MTKRRLPAEWEPQSGIMLTWPHEHSDWQPILRDVEPVFIQICLHASRFEKVLIVAYGTELQKHIHDLLSANQVNMNNILFAIARSNDSWARDHGAISVWDDDQLLLLDFEFNAWGGKYPYDLDNLISRSIEKQNLFRVKRQSVDFVLEGGSIESNGKGALLTTSCLLTTTRNPGWTQQQIESQLQTQLGITQTHWLFHGELLGDDTDAHIDTLARFVSPARIVYVKCDDESDTHFPELQKMEQELKTLRTISNDPYELIPIPLPDPVFNSKGERLPATYANFLIINGAVLLPVYNQDKDRQAMDSLQKYFPSREIVAINCLSLIEQFGSLHCVTMQFPEGVLL